MLWCRRLRRAAALVLAVACTVAACGTSGTTGGTLETPGGAPGWRRLGGLPLTGIGALQDVSAAGPRAVFAVGHTGTGQSGEAPSHPFAVRWDGAHWREITAGLPSSVLLEQVAAVSDTDAWAAGGDLVHGGNQIFHWDGESWRAVPFGALPGAGPTQEFRLSAAPGGPVWLNYFPGTEDGDPLHSTLLRWDGHQWRRQSPPCARTCGVDRTTVRSATDVWITGTESGSGSEHPLVAHWDGHRWRTTPLPTAGTPAGEVAASAPDDAWLAGWACSSVRGAQKHEEQPTMVCAGHRLVLWHWDGSGWRGAVVSGSPVDEATGIYDAAGPPGRVRLLVADVGKVGVVGYRYFDGNRWHDRGTLSLGRATGFAITAITAVPGTTAAVAVGSTDAGMPDTGPIAELSGSLT